MFKTFLFHFCHYLLAFPRTSGQAVCQRDRAAGWRSGRGVHNPEWCKFQYSLWLFNRDAVQTKILFPEADQLNSFLPFTDYVTMLLSIHDFSQKIHLFID